MRITNSTHCYIITQRQYGEMQINNPNANYCRYCMTELKVGDKVFSKTGIGKRKYYHIKCAQEVKLI